MNSCLVQDTLSNSKIKICKLKAFDIKRLFLCMVLDFRCVLLYSSDGKDNADSDDCKAYQFADYVFAV